MFLGVQIKITSVESPKQHTKILTLEYRHHYIKGPLLLFSPDLTTKAICTKFLKVNGILNGPMIALK